MFILVAIFESQKHSEYSGPKPGPVLQPVLEPVLEPCFGAIPGFGWKLRP